MPQQRRPRVRTGGRPRRATAAALLACVALVVSGCSKSAVAGTGTFQAPATAANVSAATFPIHGDGGTSFDQLARDSLTDVEQFWKQAYPTIANGAALKPLSGGVWSVTTGHPNPQEKCMQEVPKAADNNAFYCSLDDAFAYDRIGLVKIVSDKVGVNFAPLVFAHEFGHLIQDRLKINTRASIYLESQADCASGAFMAAEAGVGTVNLANRHFIIDPKTLDTVAIGMILLRDYNVHSDEDQGSHGNGFDRLTAFSDGFVNGPKYCYASNWTKRKFTERTYASKADEQDEGNETLKQVLDASAPKADGSGGGGLQPSLNAYWTHEFTLLKKTFKPVAIKEAASPPCDTSAKFGYCASDNTVYYDESTAASLYDSMPAIARDPSTGLATITQNSPADFLLGELFSMGWGLAVRSQLGLPTDSTDSLLAATCYSGAYAASINILPTTTAKFTLSPQDMDEASVAVMQAADQTDVFGPRNTTAFQRVEYFKKGYFGTLTAC